MEEIHLSVGFADMAQFKRLPKLLSWERTIPVLQDTLKAIGDIIIEHGGRIHKYGSDAILFTFHDPREAIKAAQDIVQYRHQVETLTIRYYVAIATGSVFLTELGHPTNLVEDIVGAPVLRANWMLADARKSKTGYVLCNKTRKYL